MLQPEKYKAENRPVSSSSIQRYQAKSLNSNNVNAVLSENVNSMNINDGYSATNQSYLKRTPQRQFIEGSGIACLPGSAIMFSKDEKFPN